MKDNVKKLVVTAFFLAIVLLFAFTNIGIIPIPPANVTILHIPVIIGTLICGLPTGLILGGAMGISSVIVAFTRPSALVAPMMASSPALVIAMSLLPRLLIPLVTWAVARLIKKRALSCGVAAAAGTLTNTVGYLGLMLAFYYMLGLDNGTLLGVIGGVGALNGSLETVAAVLISVPVCFALSRFIDNTPKKKEETDDTGI